MSAQLEVHLTRAVVQRHDLDRSLLTRSLIVTMRDAAVPELAAEKVVYERRAVGHLSLHPVKLSSRCHPTGLWLGGLGGVGGPGGSTLTSTSRPAR